MRILIQAATIEEIAGVQEFLKSWQPASHQVQLLVSGAGMVPAAYALGTHLAMHTYDLAINAGIAGSFDREIPLGAVVQINEDHFSELGAEDGPEFIPLDKMGFGETVFRATFSIADMPSVRGVTVNTVHGDEESITDLLKKHPVQTESMEGAAFFYACSQAGLPALQIRAISNYVEKRNKAAWQIGPAIRQLNSRLIDLLKHI